MDSLTDPQRRLCSFTHSDLSRLLLRSLHLATELLLDAGQGAAQGGDGEVTVVQLLPHPLRLRAVRLLGPVQLFSELRRSYICDLKQC